MNIEVMEFFPYTQTEDFLDGSLKIKLTGINLLVMGIYVSKKKHRWYFSLPSKKTKHHVTGKDVRFPNICFEDPVWQKAFFAMIKEKGQKFIENRIASNTLLEPNKRPGSGHSKNSKEDRGPPKPYGHRKPPRDDRDQNKT